jgi:hypothetical protein
MEIGRETMKGLAEPGARLRKNVVIMMNGGPGTVWGPRALAAYREFAGAEGG